jgi:hypothetical protein
VCSLNAAQRSSVCGPLLTSACDVHTHLRVYKHPHVAPGTPKAQTVFAVYEVAHTAVDFGAAICFLVGSVLFLYKKYETPAVWLFIVGSLFFCVKPTLRLAREIHLLRMGRTDAVAKDAPEWKQAWQTSEI